jgi:hypothetical protein
MVDFILFNAACAKSGHFVSDEMSKTKKSLAFIANLYKKHPRTKGNSKA